MDARSLTSDLSPSWQILADLLDPPEHPYLRNPVGWVEDVLGEATWSKQAAMLEAPLHHERIVVKAGHSVGKTRGLSRLAAWWIGVHPIGEALVVVTSDNDDSIKGGVWNELIALQEKVGKQIVPGNITLDAKWHAGPNNKQLVAIGRKPGDRNPTGLQGYHRRYILVILEEACGIPKELWEAADSLASNEGGIVLACGNPTDPYAHMAEVCKPGSGWEVQQIRSIDTPEFTGEVVPPSLEGVLASKAWVERQRDTLGESSPTYISRVLGEFPEISNDSLIQPNWVEAARKRDLPRDNRPHLGVDIARYGEDETTFYRREGGWVRLLHAHTKADTMVTTGHVIAARNDINAEPQVEALVEITLDEIGVGAGVLDRLVEQDVDVIGFNGAHTAYDPGRFANRRAETFWMLRDAFECGEIDIDPNDEKLAAQLGSLKWTYDSKGRIKIESKDDMRKRNMPSPDRADACAMAWSRSGGSQLVDVGSHLGQSVTGDLLRTSW